MVVADVLHTLGAGGWLGALFVVVVAGLPTRADVAPAARW
jgi:putative copper export protein